VPQQHNESLQDFLADQLASSNFWFLLLATFTITLMATWRKMLKDEVYWSGMDQQ
jgi:hypothetical protein